jgi:hypothetical protein
MLSNGLPMQLQNPLALGIGGIGYGPSAVSESSVSMTEK